MPPTPEPPTYPWFNIGKVYQFDIVNDSLSNLVVTVEQGDTFLLNNLTGAPFNVYLNGSALLASLQPDDKVMVICIDPDQQKFFTIKSA